MRKLFTIARRHPRTCAATLAGVLLCFLGTRVAWGVFDRFHAAEAARQALAGQSEAVATTRSDWPTSVGPVALLTAGQPGSEARRVASAKIDLAVRHSERGDHRRLLDEGFQLLDALRRADGVPTAEGSRWAQWLVERLAASAGRLPARDKLRLLTETEATLASLAASAQRPKLEAPVASPVAPAPSLVAEAVPPPLVAEPPAELRPPAAVPLPQRETTEVVIRQLPASRWQPNWQETQDQLLARTKPAAPPEKPPALAKPLTVPEFSDRALLAEFVKLATTLTPELTALGPNSFESADPAEDEAPARRRLRAVRLELARRGFRAITAGQVKSLGSHDPEDRLALVNRLLSVPSPNAVRLLLLLAGDESPEVRAAAISGLGSSSSRELVQTAWKLATQDTDYRVGSLAEELRRRLR